jgi:tetratricopeptide (TPR) repeat protein
MKAIFQKDKGTCNMNNRLSVFSTKEVVKLAGSAIILALGGMSLAWLRLVPVKTAIGVTGLLFIMLCLGCAYLRYIPLNKAIGLLADGEYDKALATIEKYLSHKSNASGNGALVAKVLKSNCLFYLGKFEEAAEISTEILKSTDNEEILFFARNNLISSLIELTKPMKANSEVTKLLTMDVTDTSKRDALTNIGLCYMNSEFFKEAINCWNEALNLSEDGEHKAHMLGLQAACLNRLRKYDEALEKLEEAKSQTIETNLTQAIIYDNEAYALANKNERLDEALELCKKGFELKVSAAEPHLHRSLGEVHYARAEFAAAVEELKYAISKIAKRDKNSHQKAYLILGKIYQAQGKDKEAEEALNWAISIDPEKTIAQQAQKIMAEPEVYNTAFYKVSDLEKMGLKIP